MSKKKLYPRPKYPAENEQFFQRPDVEFAEEPDDLIRQNSSYVKGGKCAPDNNPFWENGANPLSSKGN